MKDENWVVAMKLKMNALETNNTWELASLPQRRKPIG